MDDTPPYDIAVSFAGEQRDYVEQTVDACKNLGLSVFYDRDKKNEWWGKNFVREQRTIYSSQTRFFVPFLSTNYLAKSIPMDEFSAAMMTAVKQGDGYVLPVLMDDVAVPPDLLHPHIHYLHAAEFTPAELAAQLAHRVQRSVNSGTPREELGRVVEQALAVRLPKVVPLEWSKYEALGQIFDHVSTQFQRAAPQLRTQGFVCTVKRREDHLTVRVERGGESIYGLDVEVGGQMSDDQITWSFGRHRGMSSGMNGWATPKFDKEPGRTVIELSDFGYSGSDNVLSEEEFFQYLWGKMIDELERA